MKPLSANPSPLTGLVGFSPRPSLLSLANSTSPTNSQQHPSARTVKKTPPCFPEPLSELPWPRCRGDSSPRPWHLHCWLRLGVFVRTSTVWRGEVGTDGCYPIGLILKMPCAARTPTSESRPLTHINCPPPPLTTTPQPRLNVLRVRPHAPPP